MFPVKGPGFNKT